MLACLYLDGMMGFIGVKRLISSSFNADCNEFLLTNASYEIWWRLDLQIGLRAATLVMPVPVLVCVCVCVCVQKEWGFCGLVVLTILWFPNSMF